VHESCHTYGWVMSTLDKYLTRMNESCHAYASVTWRMEMRHVFTQQVSCAYKWVMPRICMPHCTHAWVMPTHDTSLPRTKESCHTHEWVVFTLSPWTLRFLRVSRPEKGEQKRLAEKANGPKIPKTPQERDISAMVKLREVCLEAYYILHIQNNLAKNVWVVDRTLCGPSLQLISSLQWIWSNWPKWSSAISCRLLSEVFELRVCVVVCVVVCVAGCVAVCLVVCVVVCDPAPSHATYCLKCFNSTLDRGTVDVMPLKSPLSSTNSTGLLCMRTSHFTHMYNSCQKYMCVVSSLDKSLTRMHGWSYTHEWVKSHI